MDSRLPGPRARRAPLSYLLCTIGLLSVTSPLTVGLHSYLPAWMRVGTFEEGNINMFLFPRSPLIFSCDVTGQWPLWPPHFPNLLWVWVSKSPFQRQAYALALRRTVEPWSQSSLCGPRSTREGIEHSFNFQEAVNPKRVCQNSLAPSRDRKIETIDFLRGPLSRPCSWGSPSSDPEKSPRVDFLPSGLQTDSPWFGVPLLHAVPGILCVIFLIPKIALWRR